MLRKTQVDIKFDRVQSITTQQNIVFRLFRLITIKLDTAGSAKQEGNLPAVNIALAESLKARIRQDSGAVDSGVDEGLDEADVSQVVERKRLLLSLGAFDMIRIGLSSNRALILLVFLGPIIEKFDQEVAESIDESVVVAAVDGAQTSVETGAAFIAMMVIGFLLFLTLASIVGAFLRYYRFELVADDRVYRSSGGLLTRHEHAINAEKIQSVVINQNIVLRIFNRYRMRAKQASSGKPGKEQSFVVPICEPADLPMLAQEFFGDEFPDVTLDPTDQVFHSIDKHYIRSRILLTGILPASVVVGLFSIVLGWTALIFLLWIPLDSLIVLRRYRRFGVLATPDGMVVRRGFVGYRVTSFLHRKIQRINVTQTVLQRGRGLATLRFFHASGSVKVPYINLQRANELRDYALYKIESSTLAWH